MLDQFCLQNKQMQLGNNYISEICARLPEKKPKMGVQSLLRQCPNKHVFFNGGLPICALWLKMIETSHEYVPSNISFQCLNRHHCQNLHSQRQNSCFSHFLQVKHKLEKLSLNTHLCFCCCFFNAKLFCANLCKVQN